MTDISAHIIDWLRMYSYVVLFPLVALEGPLATIAAGVLVSLGVMNGILTYTICILGDLAGDCAYYFLGRFSRNARIERWGRYVGLTTMRLTQLESHFLHHSGKTLFVGKLTHGIGGAILAAAGLARMRFGWFLFYNVLGTVPKSLLLLLLGYFSGQLYTGYAQYIRYTSVAALMIIILLLSSLLVRIMLKNWSSRDDV